MNGPISFGKDLLSDAQSDNLQRLQVPVSISSSSRPSPSFETMHKLSQPSIPRAPPFDIELMKEIHRRRSPQGSNSAGSGTARAVNSFVPCPMAPLDQVGSDSIFARFSSSQSSSPFKSGALNTKLTVMICKHFKKRQSPIHANNLTFLNESSILLGNSKKLKDVFKYQRSIIIQTAIIRKKIGPELFKMIDKGQINEL